MRIQQWRFAWVGALLWLCGVPLLAQADGTQLAELQEEVSLHRSLLHKRLALPTLHSFSSATRAWRPYAAKPARVRVISLWSLHCQPCVDELPMLTGIAKKWRSQAHDVQFLFLADPPDENPQQDVQEFWLRPHVARLAERCRSEKLGIWAAPSGQPVCMLDLHQADAVRSPAVDGKLPLSKAIRPLTLLVDEAGVVRDVFLGSLLQRSKQLEDAIDNLLKATRAGASASRHGPGHS